MFSWSKSSRCRNSSRHLRRSAPLLAAAACGFICADLILVCIGGAPSVRRFYTRHDLAITRASGALFLGFAAVALQAGVIGLMTGRI